MITALAAPGAPLARRNPAAKLLAATVLALALVAVVDPVTPAVVLVVELLVLPFAGVRLIALAARAWPLPVAAVGVTVTNTVFGPPGGAVLLDAGPLTVTAEPAWLGLGLGVRVLAIGLSGIVLLATTDPTDLADSLVQQCRAPARWAIAGLAAFRLLPVLAVDWNVITLARRARGIDAGRSPAAMVRLVGGQLFGLLVTAVRRGVRLATAMESRGFGTGPRTIARPQRVGAADLMLVAATAALALGATAISLALGTWRPLIGLIG